VTVSHPTRITSNSRSSLPWGVKSVMKNTLFIYVGSIIATFIDAESNAFSGGN
jgi:hypothetical protein